MVELAAHERPRVHSTVEKPDDELGTRLLESAPDDQREGRSTRSVIIAVLHLRLRLRRHRQRAHDRRVVLEALVDGNATQTELVEHLRNWLGHVGHRRRQWAAGEREAGVVGRAQLTRQVLQNLRGKVGQVHTLRPRRRSRPWRHMTM